jgi:phosphatidate cytidylyltransferase
MLGYRLATGAILIAVFVAVIIVDEWLAPWFPFWFVLTLVALGKAALELIGLLNRTSARPSGNTVFGGVMVLVVANWVPHLIGAGRSAEGTFSPSAMQLDAAFPVLVFAWMLWVFVAVVMFTFIAQSAQFDVPGGTMARISGTVLAVAYVGLLGSFVIQMRWLGGPTQGLLVLAALIATAKGADIGAYTLGRMAGRHKLWPRLSPNKTVEGALGGMGFGVVGAMAVEGVAQSLGVPLLGWPAAVGFGLVVGAAAQLGDLMESMIKRDCAQKDASDTLPGFGGVLDVLDSLLFAGPTAYGYWLLFGP